MPRFEVDADIRKAHTLPTEFYTDPAVFESGKERFFANSWQFVGDAAHVKVPGQVWPFTLLPGLIDEPLVLLRDPKEDLVRCLSNVCTHRGMQLVEGAGNERFLRCRYHGRRFGMDGTCQFMPEFEGVEGFPCEADHLKTVPHAVWGPLVFASLNPVSSFEEYLSPVFERLDWLPMDQFQFAPEHGREYMVRAHWALYCDNYLEGFHIPFIHAALNDTIEYENYTTETFDHCNLQLAVSKGADAVFELPMGHADFGKSVSAYYFWVFPNMMLNFYPWGLSINVVRPLGPDLTKVSFIPYVWREDLLGQGAGGDLDRVEREDEAVVELVQKGIRSRHYSTGRYSPKREIGTHHFHRLIANRFGP